MTRARNEHFYTIRNLRYFDALYQNVFNLLTFRENENKCSILAFTSTAQANADMVVHKSPRDILACSFGLPSGAQRFTHQRGNCDFDQVHCT